MRISYCNGTTNENKITILMILSGFYKLSTIIYDRYRLYSDLLTLYRPSLEYIEKAILLIEKEKSERYYVLSTGSSIDIYI